MSRDNNIFDVDLIHFEEQVIKASMDKIIMVDFWAAWCSPCIVLDPILKSVIKESPHDIALAKLEVDKGDNMKLAGKYQVRGFPTVILFYQDREIDRFVSAQSASFINSFISNAVESIQG